MIKEYLNGHTTPDIKYFYDDLNRLIEVKDVSNQTIATYTYDAFNRRITKTVGSTTERYTYDDWDIVEISTNSNDYTNIIDSAMDRHIAIEVTANNTSTLYYFLTDERGNVTALTDANGNILERYRYRVYGDFEILDTQFAPKNCNNQTCYATNLHNFLWGGSLYEPETGLYWMRNRYYHIDMHRFINQDPIGIWGDTNNLGNGFAYVAGMVVEASDPSGLDLVITVVRYKYDDDVIYSVIFLESTDYPEEVNGKVFYGLERNNGKDVNAMPAGVYRRDTKFREDGRVKFRVEYTKRNHQVHVGNYPWDSKGCVIPGKYFGPITKADRDAKIKEYENNGELEKAKLAEDTKFKTGIWNSRSVMNLIQKVAMKDGHYVPTTVIIEDPSEFVPPNEEQANKQEKPILPTPEKTSDDEVTWTQTTRTVWSNGTVVDCEFGSCHCVLNCAGTGSGNMPSDPEEDPSNAIQKILMSNILAKMLKRGESEQPPVFVDTGTGPNGTIKIYRNLYYVSKDPLKTILFNGDNGSGKPMIYRNPFVPGAEYGYDATTYDKWQQSGFVQPNVDPYWY
ncbi:MAG: hypothetical protein K5860_03220 [Bacteroidales bacterium]|nr:hypothetical protein [Bacteroidales bacterium]